MKPDETHIMQLAAISTASGQNTRTSVKDRIGRESPYWTQAYQDVCVAIDREMHLREELGKMVKRCHSLREALVEADAGFVGSPMSQRRIDKALKESK